MYLLAGGHVCARRFLQRAASSVVVGLIVCKLLQHVPSSGKGGPLNQASNGDYVGQLPQDLSWSLVYSGQTKRNSDSQGLRKIARLMKVQRATFAAVSA